MCVCVGGGRTCFKRSPPSFSNETRGFFLFVSYQWTPRPRSFFSLNNAKSSLELLLPTWPNRVTYRKIRCRQLINFRSVTFIYIYFKILVEHNKNFRKYSYILNRVLNITTFFVKTIVIILYKQLNLSFNSYPKIRRFFYPFSPIEISANVISLFNKKFFKNRFYNIFYYFYMIEVKLNICIIELLLGLIPRRLLYRQNYRFLVLKGKTKPMKFLKPPNLYLSIRRPCKTIGSKLRIVFSFMLWPGTDYLNLTCTHRRRCRIEGM